MNRAGEDNRRRTLQGRAAQRRNGQWEGLKLILSSFATIKQAGRDCGWYHGQPHREKTTAPYGWPVATPPESPYFLSDADQYSLDHIVATRIFSYPHLVPLLSTPPPDFIFVPILSQLWSNPWGCQDPNLLLGISQTTQLLRKLVAQVGPSSYPKIVVAVSPIRSQLERNVFTPEIMEEFKDSLVVVSIENALKSTPEGMNYTIDLPCTSPEFCS